MLNSVELNRLLDGENDTVSRLTVVPSFLWGTKSLKPAALVNVESILRACKNGKRVVITPLLYFSMFPNSSNG